MDKFMIQGGTPLSGELTVQGAKNSVLPIMAGCILTEERCVLTNCPKITDLFTAVDILKELGCDVKTYGNTTEIRAKTLQSDEIPDMLMREMRSSVMFLGAIIARVGSATISFPGGCELGPRPIDLHIDSLKKLGVKFREEHGYIFCSAPNGLTGVDIALSFPSVGATENIILAAVTAKGTTTISNAAMEPEIVDLQNFLNQMGADIKGAGENYIIIKGVPKLYGTYFHIMTDRIAAATYLMAAAITKGNLLLTSLQPQHLRPIISILNDVGVPIEVGNDYIKVSSASNLLPVRYLRTMPHPGFPTDAQAPLMSLLSIANGTSAIVETIFDNRFKHVDELARMGAKIKIEGRLALIEGVKNLTGATVEATDLRGGAALILAGLSANGNSTIENIKHIDRGYEAIEDVLTSLGANIKRI